MPVDPGLGEDQAGPVRDRLEQLELRLIQLVRDMLTADADSGMDDGAWLRSRQAEALRLHQQIDAAVAAAVDPVRRAVAEAVLAAYRAGQSAGLDELAELQALVDAAPAAAAAPATAGLESDVTARPPVEVQRAAVRVAANGPTRAVLTALQVGGRRAGDVYAQAVRQVSQLVLARNPLTRDRPPITRLQASQRALDDLLARGITGFRDAAGRSWTLTSYAEMAVRTATGQAAVQGHVDTMQAAGRDLVVVSDAPRECPLCRPFEGKVLSISGRTPTSSAARSLTTGREVRVRVAASLAEARSRGFQHPNCRHSLSAYLPGATVLQPARSEPAQYEQVQRQRAIERQIRSWKLREAVAVEPAAQRAARAKVAGWQAAQRAHVAAHPYLKRRTVREQPTKAH